MTNLRAEFDIYKSINLEFSAPLTDFEKEKLKLSIKSDSVFIPVSYDLFPDSLNPRKYKIQYNWQHDKTYQLLVDSAAFHSNLGIWNDRLETVFKIKPEDRYGTLDLNIYGLPADMSAFVELLNKSDVPVYRATVKDGHAIFLYLDPETYYARIILDRNNNGKWDSGNYSQGFEPEMVCYYNKPFEIKELWDFDDDWNIWSTPIDKQKPLEITQNKPQDENKRRREMEKRDARQNKKRSREEERERNNGRNGNNSYNNNNRRSF